MDLNVIHYIVTLELLTMCFYGIFIVIFVKLQVHGSVNGRKFKSMLQTQHIELLQSPWLMELGAFCINSSSFNDEDSGVYDHKFSCELSDTRSVMELTLSDSVKLEYNLTCAVCLV